MTDEPTLSKLVGRNGNFEYRDDVSLEDGYDLSNREVELADEY